MIIMEGLFHHIQMLILPGFILGAILLIFGSTVAGRAIILVVVFALFLPFIWQLFPTWITFVIIALISLVFLQAILSLILGQRIAESVTGNLVTDLFRIIIRVILLPLQIIRRFINWQLNRKYVHLKNESLYNLQPIIDNSWKTLNTRRLFNSSNDINNIPPFSLSWRKIWSLHDWNDLNPKFSINIYQMLKDKAPRPVL